MRAMGPAGDHAAQTSQRARRRQARQIVAAYHEQQLRELLEHVRDGSHAWTTARSTPQLTEPFERVTAWLVCRFPHPPASSLRPWPVDGVVSLAVADSGMADPVVPEVVAARLYRDGLSSSTSWTHLAPHGRRSHRPLRDVSHPRNRDSRLELRSRANTRRRVEDSSSPRMQPESCFTD